MEIQDVWRATLLLVAFLVGCSSSSDDSGTPAVDGSDTPTVETSVDVGERATAVDTGPSTDSPPPFDRGEEIARSGSLLSSGKPKEAAEVLRKLMLIDPSDVEVLFHLANLEASTGDLAGAIELLDSIPNDHPEAGLPALGQSADWSFQLQRYDEAEKRYAKVIERVPTAGVALRQLAYLLNRQGRRHEAAVHIRALCRLGDVRQDELHSLMVLGNAVYQDPATQPAGGDRPYWPIGPMAEARKLFTDYKFGEAAELLSGPVATGKALPSMMAFYGRLVAESQDEEAFLDWLAKTDESTRQFSEYWAGLGTYLVNERRFEEAIGALAEAIDRDPTDASSIRRMNESLLALGQTEEAEKWFDRFAIIRETTLASNKVGESSAADPESFATVADGLRKMHRPLEAVMWEVAGAFRDQPSQQQMQALNEKLQSTLRAEDLFANRTQRLCGLDTSRFPIPDLQGRAAAPDARPVEMEASIETPRFENVASEIGLTHTYQVASQPQPFRFALYQTLGGGVAVLDYDLDGNSDLYFAQGASDATTFVGTQSNQLFRSVAVALNDVTEVSGTSERRYSIGATGGDWNQDGFPDLVVTGIGGSDLMVNNGDGTFARHPLWVSDRHVICPSSVAMADVTADGLPDIVEVLYANDPKMTEQPDVDELGNVIGVAVASYNAARDRIYVNDGMGGFLMNEISDADGSVSTGLGVVVTDFDGKPGNEIFVGNDIRANHFWSRGDQGEWSDLASLLGCAFGNGGILTASMGIAAADFDGSGTPDLHVTNFLLEPASLFVNRGGSFEDRAIQYRLANDSRSVLGFGTQAIDYDNNGRRDLIVTNGHVEKPSNPQEPFHQRPQLFVNAGRRFQLTDVSDASSYFGSTHLGRGLARLDFNRDGKSDFVVTHVGAPSALLLNETLTNHHWLDIQLVGTDGERDCVGARVQVHAGEKVWSDWSISGDGYLASNESVLHFGLGDVTDVGDVVVTWPSGKEQVFGGFSSDKHYLLVENQATPFEL